jgi:predicted amidohydrolase YtcJ
VRVGKAVDVSAAKSESDLILFSSALHRIEPEPKNPTVADLDRIQNWVVIRHWCCREHWFNSHTIALMAGSEFDRISGVIYCADGRMTGVLED